MFWKTIFGYILTWDQAWVTWPWVPKRKRQKFHKMQGTGRSCQCNQSTRYLRMSTGQTSWYVTVGNAVDRSLYLVDCLNAVLYIYSKFQLISKPWKTDWEWTLGAVMKSKQREWKGAKIKGMNPWESKPREWPLGVNPWSCNELRRPEDRWKAQMLEPHR